MELMEELVEEVLLRFPPSDPASLVRAALVCKQWCRVVASAGFRRRFRELHGTPPLLGVLCHLPAGEGSYLTRFVSVNSCPPQVDQRDCGALDARHGRVLFLSLSSLPWVISLRVWDPVTGEHYELPEVPPLVKKESTWDAAAVLCAANGSCDHLDCHGGPFLVVFVRAVSGKMRVNVYSSETGIWTKRISGVQSPTADLKPVFAPALVGNALYFLADASIVKYELTTRNMFVIQTPSDFSVDCAVLMTVKDGGLGVAGLKDSRLYLWSMETDSRGDVGWVQIGVVQLQTLLPVNIAISYDYVAFAHGVGIFFVGTKEGLFSIDLKSYKAKKVCDGECGEDGIYSVVPYMSFYTPVLRIASKGDGCNGVASGA